MQRRVRACVLIVDQRAAGKLRQQLAQRLMGVRTAAGGDEVHPVSRVDHGAEHRVLSVHRQHRRHCRFAPQNNVPPVQRQRQALSGSAQHIGIGVSVHQQNIPQGHHAAAEQLRGLAVEQDDIAVVQQAHARRDGDAQRRRILGVIQLDRIGVGALGKVVSRHGYPLFVHIQLFSDPLLQTVELAAAAGQKECGGGRAVDADHLLSNGRGQLFHRLLELCHHFVIGQLVFQAHNIGVVYGLSLPQRTLDVLRRLEIDQI